MTDTCAKKKKWVFYTKNFSFSKVKKQMKQLKHINLTRYSILSFANVIYDFITFRLRSHRRDHDIFMMWHANVALSRVPDSIDRTKTNVPDIYMRRLGRRPEIDGSAWHFDRNALKERKRLIEIIGYKRQTDEIEKRKEIPSLPRDDLSYRTRVTRHRQNLRRFSRKSASCNKP